MKVFVAIMHDPDIPADDVVEVCDSIETAKSWVAAELAEVADVKKIEPLNWVSDDLGGIECERDGQILRIYETNVRS